MRFQDLVDEEQVGEKGAQVNGSVQVATGGRWLGGTGTYNPNNTTLNAQFPGYAITSVNREFQKDRMAYEILLSNGTSRAKVLIDANGNIIKQKTKIQ